MITEEEARKLPARVAAAIRKLKPKDREFVRHPMLDREPESGRPITPESAWTKVHRLDPRLVRLWRAFRGLRSL